MNFHNDSKFTNKIVLYLFFIFLSVKVGSSGLFIDIKKLSTSDKYFVVLDTGLYLYNFYNYDCSLIHQFSKLKNYDDRIIIDNLNDEKNSYILCLVNQYLFIFNEYNNKTIDYILNEISSINKNDYCNIMPYKIENENISFIIAFNNQTSKLTFYYYNFSLNEKTNSTKEIVFDNMNIKNKMIRCLINSYLSFIKCFYYEYVNEINYLSGIIFNIKNMDLVLDKTFNTIVNNEIKQIKSAMSYNHTLIFLFVAH